MRGIRDFGQGDYLVDPAWRKGYSLLARSRARVLPRPRPREDGRGAGARGDVSGRRPLHRPRRLSRASAAASTSRSGGEAMETVAGAPNTIVKISGLGMCDNAWTVASWRPWVLACIELWGVERTVLRHELARRPALQLLRRRARRLRADPVAASRTPSRSPSSRRTPSGSSASNRQARDFSLRKRVDHLLIDLDPEPDARRRIHPAVDVVDRGR